MGRGSLGASRGIAAATSAAAPKGQMPAAIQQHLQQEQRTIAHEVDTLTPGSSWAVVAYMQQQARVRHTADGYEVQLFSHGSATPQEGLFADLKRARRAIRNHLGV